jgi:hypothetical protein
MRKFLFLICILAIPFASSAWGKPPAWQKLNQLHEGDKIQVHVANAKIIRGTFMNISDAAISVETIAGPQTIQRQDVQGVKLMIAKHRLRNALILAGVGFGVGAGIGEATHKGCASTQTLCLDFTGGAVSAGIGGVIGMLGGGAIGALVPEHPTLYNANSH